MFHYVYKLEDPNTGEFYFGSRSCKCMPEKDRYKGSMNKWKPNRSTLIKTIIKSDFQERFEANALERKLILEHYKDDLNRNYCVPSNRPSQCGALPGEKNAFYGQTHTDETREKLSKFASARVGEKNPMWGKNHSDEAKRLMSLRKKNIYTGSKNSMARKLWQYDLEGNLLRVWDCAKYCVDHHKDMKLSRGNISSTATHNSKPDTTFLKRTKTFYFAHCDIKDKISSFLNEG